MAGFRICCYRHAHSRFPRARGALKFGRHRVKECIGMRMKKFINEPRRIVPELLEGLALAFPDKVRLAGDGIVARAKSKSADKVRIVTLGGSGHEPGLSGFVGEGMLDYSVAGEIFAAPGAPKVIEALRQACAGGGTALLVVRS